jgi:8-hydroxy-5-deazaflavin:NADPH oxidoreductase
VVKAFNTTFAPTLLAGQVAGEPLDVFIAGDDEDAKSTVATLVRDGGLRPIDAGALERSRQLEGLGLLGITLQGALGTQFGTAWKLVMPADG